MAGVEVRAVQRNNRMSAQKVRLVLDVVRGKNAREALAILRFLPQRAARPVAATVRSAVANAENNFNIPRARGRVNQILKRSSHITVVVAEKG